MRSAVAVVLLLPVVANAQVTVTTAELNIPGYYEKLKSIGETRVVGYRTAAVRRLWDTTKPQVREPSIVDNILTLHGKELWLLRTSSPPPHGGGKERYVWAVTPDAYYFLELKPSGKYAVGGHGTEWGKPGEYAQAVALFPAAVQLYQPSRVREVTETVDDEFEGRLTLRITVRTRDGITMLAHIDRRTGQHLYSESDKVLDLKARGYVDGKVVRRTEYREEGGRLWPTREETYQIGADGQKQMVSETVITEYVPYTPTADELDLEKQFGVKPIPHEPRPASAVPKPVPAERTAFWLYVAAGVLAVVAGAVLLVRRRRTATA